ncbi:hypothetical protein FRC10_004495 [Ceratobasidium sp. 414]|nr:hypothetical protein FRC10_004495 [Ceratobasidium sp. 414]
MADCIAQDIGLSGAARQQLYCFAIQAMPDASALWNFAGALRNTTMLEDVQSKLNHLDDRLDTLTDLVREEFKISKGQEKMIKKLMRRYMVMAQTSYQAIPDHIKASLIILAWSCSNPRYTQRYIAKYPAQFSLELYNTDDTIKLVVNQFVMKEWYQCRGSFRKARQIVHERITLIQAMEAAAAAAQPQANEGDQGDAPNATGGHRGNTGFWEAVDHRFESLVRVLGTQYDGHAGWAQLV